MVSTGILLGENRDLVNGGGDLQRPISAHYTQTGLVAIDGNERFGPKSKAWYLHKIIYDRLTATVLILAQVPISLNVQVDGGALGVEKVDSATTLIKRHQRRLPHQGYA